jgi:hypothetical protein
MRRSETPARRATLRALAGAGIAAGLATVGLVAAGAAAAQSTAQSAGPPAGPSTEALHTLHIADGKVRPDEQLISARKGDRIHLRVVSDKPGEMHLHAYRLSLKLLPGQESDVTFEAFATGRFRLEFHPANAQGAPAEAHEAAPLATLEVRPT